ncbi:MAG: DUF2269 family protein [Desulfurococcales archaeon]|nr:DUF2269 family protein [Desulfurococcales archaeon]
MFEYNLILLSWLHLIGVIVWIGGSIFISIVLTPAAKALDPAAVSRLNRGISRRFTPIAMGSAVLLAITGMIRAGSVLYDGSLTSSTYGMILAVKISLFIVMVASGILITITARGLDKLDDPVSTKARIKRIGLLGKFIIVLGLLVIALAATLGTLHENALT